MTGIASLPKSNGAPHTGGLEEESLSPVVTSAHSMKCFGGKDQAVRAVATMVWIVSPLGAGRMKPRLDLATHRSLVAVARRVATGG